MIRDKVYDMPNYGEYQKTLIKLQEGTADDYMHAVDYGWVTMKKWNATGEPYRPLTNEEFEHIKNLFFDKVGAVSCESYEEYLTDVADFLIDTYGKGQTVRLLTNGCVRVMKETEELVNRKTVVFAIECETYDDYEEKAKRVRMAYDSRNGMVSENEKASMIPPVSEESFLKIKELLKNEKVVIDEMGISAIDGELSKLL